MLTLQTLGHIRLVRPDGTEIDELLRQPKRLALLAYLCSPKPGVWHRRDVLLAVFWSELDAPRARTALRNALYILRQHLGDRVVRTRGDEEVSIDPELLTSDVALLETDVIASRFEDALERYGGDMLPGLHISAAAGFEDWLDEERSRIKALAKSASLGLADMRERSGDFDGAASALTRTAKLDPIDEAVVRRLVSLHDRIGDRAHAFAAYDRLRAHLAAEFDAEPAPETVALVDAIRARRSPERSAGSHSPDSPRVTPTPALTTRFFTPLTGPIAPIAEKPVLRVHNLRRFALPAAALVVASTVTLASLTSRPPAAPRPRVLIVMPMENATGRPDVAYLATGIDDEIAKRLRGIGGLETTKSAARSDWPAAARNDPAGVGREFGVDVAFRGRLTIDGDSLVVTGGVVDVATGRARDIGRHPFVVDSAQDAASRVAAAIAGTLFRSAIPEIPRGRTGRLVDGESFRLTLAGWHAQFGPSDLPKAKELFIEATNRDPSNARAWAGLSSSWGALAVQWKVPFEEGAARSEAAAERALALDSLEGSAWMNLALVRGIRARSLRVADQLLDKAIAADPGNAEIYLIKASLYRFAGDLEQARDAVRIARQMDPLGTGAVGREAVLGLCGNDPDESLRLYRVLISMSSQDVAAHRGAARALARLGQWDEAIVELRIAQSLESSTPSLVDSTVTGERGYWSLIHVDGKKRLAAALERQRTGWVSPTQLASLRIASGDIEGGLDDLEKEAVAAEFGPYRARCQPDFEEARSSPRFQRLMAALPAWELPDSVSAR